MQNDQDGETLPTMLRVAEVAREVGVSKDTLYRMLRAGGFPRPVKVAANSVRWRRDEVLRWLNELPPANAE